MESLLNSDSPSKYVHIGKEASGNNQMQHGIKLCTRAVSRSKCCKLSSRWNFPSSEFLPRLEECVRHFSDKNNE